MKKLTILLATIATLFSATLFTSCSEPESNEPESNEPTIVGTWEQTSEVAEDDKIVGRYVRSISFNSDGTGSWVEYIEYYNTGYSQIKDDFEYYYNTTTHILTLIGDGELIEIFEDCNKVEAFTTTNKLRLVFYYYDTEFERDSFFTEVFDRV